MMNQQYADGTERALRERDGAEMTRIGGYAGPAGSNVPDFPIGSTMRFNIAGVSDSAGGIQSWQNNLGFDILVTGHQLNITTVATGICTVSVGQTATNGTTLSSNMLSGVDVHTATGVKNPGSPIGILVPKNTWITASTASGASAGLVGLLYFQYNPA